MVVDVVPRRHPAAPPVADPVKRRHHPELHAPRPQRRVVVKAVVAQRVDPRGGHPVGPNATWHHPAHDHRFEAEDADGVVELGHRLVGTERGDEGDRLQTVAVVGKDARVVRVQRPTRRQAQLVVGVAQDREPRGREEQGEVEADLLQALVEQPGQQDGHPVEPERVAEEHPRREVARARGERGSPVPYEPLRDRVVGHLAHAVDDHRHELDQVAVGIDDRMRQTTTYLRHPIAWGEIQRHRHLPDPRDRLASNATCCSPDEVPRKRHPGPPIWGRASPNWSGRPQRWPAATGQVARGGHPPTRHAGKRRSWTWTASRIHVILRDI